MTDHRSVGVETLAYTARQPPWVGNGNAVDPKSTPEQMLKAASLDWEVVKKPLFYLEGDGSQKRYKIPGKYALVRETDNQLMSIVADRYKPIQNAEHMAFFKAFTEAGQMQMEHAGSLWHGSFIWALARVNQADFSIGKGDNEDMIKAYLLLVQSHRVGHAMVGMGTAMKDWCWNSLTAKLSARGDGVFRFPHSKSFDAVSQEKAKETLGLVSKQMVDLKEQVTKLASVKIADNKLDEYFHEVIEFDPRDATINKDGTVREPKMLPMLREAYTKAPGQQITTSRGTLWGAVGAVTYVTDHQMGRDRSLALHGAWLSKGAELKRRAMNVALKLAA